MNWYFRGLGVILFLAFWSCMNQFPGLVGPRGILPIHGRLRVAFEEAGWLAGVKFPTLVWFLPEDYFPYLLCTLGLLAAVAIVFDVYRRGALFLGWLFYLSLSVAGQTFGDTMWDRLLIETLFCSIFLVPSPSQGKSNHPAVGRLLMTFLLFKVMFLAGLQKLLAGPDFWWNLTAMVHHFETQPFPTPLAWYLQKLPVPLLQAFTALTLVVEVFVPFCLFGSRRVRFFGVCVLAGFQVLLVLTGNFGLLTFLILLLCFLQLDDNQLARFVPGMQFLETNGSLSSGENSNLRTFLVAVVILLNVVMVLGLVPGRPLQGIRWGLDRWQTINTYRFFSRPPSVRRELVLQGRHVGSWESYRFRKKITVPDRRPPLFVLPPRLDSQVWALGYGNPARVAWFRNFLVRLLQGSKPVANLLAETSSGGEPPSSLRVLSYQYRFTDWETGTKTGRWWERDRRKVVIPPVELGPSGLVGKERRKGVGR